MVDLLHMLLLKLVAESLVLLPHDQATKHTIYISCKVYIQQVKLNHNGVSG